MPEKEPTFKSLIQAVSRAYDIAARLERKAENDFQCSPSDNLLKLDYEDAMYERARLAKILHALKRQS